jgi:uncharacterized protein
MTDHVRPQRIAVIGSGVAGLTCAYQLAPRHDVVVFEAQGRLGGHANTVEVDDPAAGVLGVDTGFIVHNDRNYPNFVRLMDQLRVETQPSEMSFSVTDDDPTSATRGLCYRATNLRTLFAEPRNLTRPQMWRMLRDIVAFYRAGQRFLLAPLHDVTIGEFVAQHGLSQAFVDLHLVPLGSSVWSADPARFVDFPAFALLRFLDNHGLLGFGHRPQWRTITGGSKRYVDALRATTVAEFRLSTPVVAIKRVNDAVAVWSAGATELFDHVILAVHSDQAVRLQPDIVPDERRLLEAIRFQSNVATLHTDTMLLPRRRAAWAGWNYRRTGPGQRTTQVTYDLTTLQRLPGSRRYLVSLNSDESIDPATVLASFTYEHPIFDTAALRAQAQLASRPGHCRVHYCGAWRGYGFHEDGVVAALDLCRTLGPTRAVGRRQSDDFPLVVK